MTDEEPGSVLDPGGGLYLPPQGTDRTELLNRLTAHPCRYCDAPPGTWCHTATGARLGALHRARYWAELTRLRDERKAP